MGRKRRRRTRGGGEEEEEEIEDAKSAGGQRIADLQQKLTIYRLKIKHLLYNDSEKNGKIIKDAVRIWREMAVPAARTGLSFCAQISLPSLSLSRSPALVGPLGILQLLPLLLLVLPWVLITSHALQDTPNQMALEL